MRRALAVLLLLGCRGGFEPPKQFVGTLKETGRAEIDIGPGAKPGEVIVNWWNTDRPKGDVEAKIERLGERRIRIQVGGCGVQLEQDPPPNDYSAKVVLKPQQVCDIDIDHYKGPVYLGGNVQFDPSKGTIDLLLHGTAPQGPTRVQYSLTYNGVAKK